jgi:3-deoxy-D-manno-octulosonic-acid transferase
LSPGEVDCLVVNTTGELKFFYEPADVVFVGKSLTAIGGQNPIEPGAQGKTIVFGPNMQNFADITRNFLKQDAAVQVKDAAALERVLGELLANPARRAELGRNAEKVVAENLGAVERTVEMILPHLKENGFFIAPEK